MTRVAITVKPDGTIEIDLIGNTIIRTDCVSPDAVGKQPIPPADEDDADNHLGFRKPAVRR